MSFAELAFPSESVGRGLHYSRLLVVDDQPSITRIVSRVAETCGYEVRVVNNPIEAVAAFLDFRPDVLLIDLIMPQMDGLDVLSRILSWDPDIMVILTTGYGSVHLNDATAISAVFRPGKLKWLRKPFRTAALRSALTEFTDDD